MWFKKSANHGDPDAQNALFNICIEQGYYQDVPEAMRWLRKACDQNFGPAMESFNKIVSMAKSYNYQEHELRIKLLRWMGLDV